jgi:hypothetical protein
MSDLTIKIGGGGGGHLPGDPRLQLRVSNLVSACVGGPNGKRVFQPARTTCLAFLTLLLHKGCRVLGVDAA